jgi:murein DD-endopeptidase MepM/ murein hydrolase activator NlpD
MPSPVDSGRITQVHGPTNEPRDGAYAGHAHFNKGVDYSVPVGTPARAVSDGTVVRVIDEGSKSWGLRVEYRDSEGVIHSYGHLSGANVKVGDTVRAGQVLATTGNSGASTGPHLSYQVNVGGQYVDPSPWLGFSASGDNRTPAKTSIGRDASEFRGVAPTNARTSPAENARDTSMTRPAGGTPARRPTRPRASPRLTTSS